MHLRGHPFAVVVAKLLGLDGESKLAESAVNYFLMQRQSFADKFAQSGGSITFWQLMDYTRDKF